MGAGEGTSTAGRPLSLWGGGQTPELASDLVYTGQFSTFEHHHTESVSCGVLQFFF